MSSQLTSSGKAYGRNQAEQQQSARARFRNDVELQVINRALEASLVGVPGSDAKEDVAAAIPGVIETYWQEAKIAGTDWRGWRVGKGVQNIVVRSAEQLDLQKVGGAVVNLAWVFQPATRRTGA